MHELAIANSIFEAVQAEAERHPRARPRRVGLRIGDLAGVDPEALQFSFEAIVKGTRFEPLPMEMERCPRRQACPVCGHTFAMAAPEDDPACPSCGHQETNCIGGTELELSFLELEEQ